jgi:hypothetical protein
MPLLSIEYLWKQLDHKKNIFFKNESIEDMKWCIIEDDSSRRINKDLTTMNHTSKKSEWKYQRRGTGYDGEGQVEVQFEE